MTLWKWSVTAADNDDADSTINMRENQAPSTYNNAVRAAMAAIKKMSLDLGGNIVAGGTATAMTATTNQVISALDATTDGFTFSARMSATSGADPTLAVDGLTAKQIRKVYGTNIATGALLINGVYQFTYDSTDDAWIVSGRFGDTLTSGDNLDLVAIEAIATASGVLRKSAANTWAVDAGPAHLAATTADRLLGTDGAGAVGVATITTPLAYSSSALSVGAAADAAAGVIELAVQSEMETGTDVARAVVPGRQHFHPAHIKSWALVDGVGTVNLRSSHGMASVDDDGFGNYTVNFSTAFSSSNYACLCSPGDNTVVNADDLRRNAHDTTSYSFVCAAGGSDADGDYLAVAFVGDYS
jgi:hypothetical protein